MWEIFAFEYFCCLVRNEKTWFLYVAGNKGFLEYSTAKTTKQNNECVKMDYYITVG